MSGNTSRKHGSNKDACKLYASSHREERNKKRNVARQARFERRQEAKKSRRIAAAAKDTRKRVPKKWTTLKGMGKHTLIGVGLSFQEMQIAVKDLGLTTKFVERVEVQRKNDKGDTVTLDAWRYAYHFGEEAA